MTMTTELVSVHADGASRPVPMQVYSDGDELAQALAGRIAQALRERIESDGVAWLAVSGGTTPRRMFERLSAIALPWQQVVVTLVDERCVAESSARSNAGLVRAHLLQGAAVSARFVPLFDETAGSTAREAAEHALEGWPGRFAAVVLGMGADGHTASFFPGGDRLAEALEPSLPGRRIESMQAPGAGEPRLTLTLPVVVAADVVALQIEGQGKRDTLAQALQEGPVDRMPIRAVLRRSDVVLTIFWSP